MEILQYNYFNAIKHMSKSNNQRMCLQTDLNIFIYCTYIYMSIYSMDCASVPPACYTLLTFFSLHLLSLTQSTRQPAPVEPGSLFLPSGAALILMWKLVFLCKYTDSGPSVGPDIEKGISSTNHIHWLVCFVLFCFKNLSKTVLYSHIMLLN